MTLRVGSLFTGIGGFDIGLERAGMRVAWQCEADEFCRRALAYRWPGVPCYPDIRGLRGADVQPVDVLCGGFPCQDISLAGKGAGIDGARSGLWGEYARLVGELRPRYVIVENVSALLSRGLGRVLGDLAALGYDAEWDCIPASAVGAPHRRDRLWLVAYPDGSGRVEGQPDLQAGQSDAKGSGADLAHAECGGRQGRSDLVGRDDLARDAAERREGAGNAPGGGQTPGTHPDPDAGRRQERSEQDGDAAQPRLEASQRHDPDGLRSHVADAELAGLEGHRSGALRPGAATGGGSGELQDADERALQPWRVGGRAAQAGGPEWWAVEPPVGRVAHGVPDRLAQLAAYGNALVPQIPEWISERILDYEGQLVAELVA